MPNLNNTQVMKCILSKWIFFMYFWCASPNVWGNLHNTCLLIFKYAFLKKSEWNNFFCLHRLIPKDQCFHSRRRRAADVAIVWLPCPDDHVTHYIQYHPPNMIHLHLCQTHLNKRKEKKRTMKKLNSINKWLYIVACLSLNLNTSNKKSKCQPTIAVIDWLRTVFKSKFTRGQCVLHAFCAHIRSHIDIDNSIWKIHTTKHTETYHKRLQMNCVKCTKFNRIQNLFFLFHELVIWEWEIRNVRR